MSFFRLSSFFGHHVCNLVEEDNELRDVQIPVICRVLAGRPGSPWQRRFSPLPALDGTTKEAFRLQTLP